MTKLTPKEWSKFWIYFKSEPHQLDALDKLYYDMPSTLLQDDSRWVEMYRSGPPEPEKKPGPVTPELMQRFSGHSASSYDQAFCDDFNDLLETTGFGSDLTAFRMLISQMAHETANWKYMKEIGDNAYFTKMYEGRSDLGNNQPGDGARFSGCGAIQCTGRANFQASYDYLQQKRGLNDPRIMAEGTSYTADVYPFSICIGWLINNDYLNLCKGGDIVACTRRLNGGTNGLDDRMYWYEKAQRVILQSDLT
jgi:predicted chitinase